MKILIVFIFVSISLSLDAFAKDCAELKQEEARPLDSKQASQLIKFFSIITILKGKKDAPQDNDELGSGVIGIRG